MKTMLTMLTLLTMFTLTGCYTVRDVDKHNPYYRIYTYYAPYWHHPYYPSPYRYWYSPYWGYHYIKVKPPDIEPRPEPIKQKHTRTK